MQAKENIEKEEKKGNYKSTFQNVWIVKPGENTNRGCGIVVSKDFNEIKELVRSKTLKYSNSK